MSDLISDQVMSPNSMELTTEEHSIHVISDLIFSMHLFYNDMYLVKMKILSNPSCADCDWTKEGMHNYLQKLCVHFHNNFFITFQLSHSTKIEKLIADCGTELSSPFSSSSSMESDIFSKFMFICAAVCEYDLFRLMIGQHDSNYSSVLCLYKIFKDRFESHISNIGGWKSLEKFCLKRDMTSSIEKSLRPMELSIDHLFDNYGKIEGMLFALNKCVDGDISNNTENESGPEKKQFSHFVKRLFVAIGEARHEITKALQYLYHIAGAVIQFSEYHRKTFQLIFEKCFPSLPKSGSVSEFMFFKSCSFLYLYNICLTNSVFEFVAMCAFAFELQRYIDSKPGKNNFCVQEVFVEVLIRKFGDKCEHLPLYLSRICAVCEGMTNGIHILADDSLGHPPSLLTLQSTNLQDHLCKTIISVEKGELKYEDIKNVFLTQESSSMSLDACFDESLAVFMLIISEYKSSFSLPGCWDVSLFNGMYEMNNKSALEFAKSLKPGIQEFCGCLRKYFRILFEMDRPDLMTSKDDLGSYLLCRSLFITDNPTLFSYLTTYAFMLETLIYFMKRNETISVGNTDVLVKVASKSFKCFLQERFKKACGDNWKEDLQCYSLGTCSKIYTIHFENSSEESCDTNFKVIEREETQLLKKNLTKFLFPVYT